MVDKINVQAAQRVVSLEPGDPRLTLRRRSSAQQMGMVVDAGGRKSPPVRGKIDAFDGPEVDTLFLDHFLGEIDAIKSAVSIAHRDFLDRGGKTGFVRGTDTHEGKPEARTAVLANELTREVIFDALRHRRNYAVTNARIVSSFRIDGHEMGEEIETAGKPHIDVEILGTDLVREVEIVRDGEVLHSLSPGTQQVKFRYVDESFRGSSCYYYLRVTQADKDEHGNLSRAWSSPIWVTGRHGSAAFHRTSRKKRQCHFCQEPNRRFGS